MRSVCTVVSMTEEYLTVVHIGENYHHPEVSTVHTPP